MVMIHCSDDVAKSVVDAGGVGVRSGSSVEEWFAKSDGGGHQVIAGEYR